MLFISALTCRYRTYKSGVLTNDPTERFSYQQYKTQSNGHHTELFVFCIQTYTVPCIYTSPKTSKLCRKVPYLHFRYKCFPQNKGIQKSNAQTACLSKINGTFFQKTIKITLKLLQKMALNVSGSRVIRMLGLINLFVSNRKLTLGVYSVKHSW